MTSWMRALGLPMPGDVPLGADGLYLAVVFTPASSSSLLAMWLAADGDGPGELGVLVRSRLDIALAESGPPTADRATTTLDREVTRAAVTTRRECGVDALADRPLEGLAGATQTVVCQVGEGPVREASARSPVGQHAEVTGLIADLVAGHLGAGWNLRAIAAVHEVVRREIERADRARPTATPEGRTMPGIRTRSLFLRFRMFEPLYTRGPARWWSLFEDGVLQRFDGSGHAHRGVARAPRRVPEELLAPTCALFAARDWSAVTIPGALSPHDDDRNITLEVQWPDRDGALVSQTFAWSYGRAAPQLDAVTAAELERVHALYRALMAVRQLADLA
ncbi:MAG: hypothetical protein ACK6CU_18250 [Deltaproteobacteria bacterium]